jgi:tRNA-2-methylthio-N6-dimethylallyladenosine synthase
MTSDNKPPLLYMATFGCQMNEYDSNRIVNILADRGYETTTHLEEADFIFLNTCSIRDKAEQKVYSFLGRLRPLKDQNRYLLIGVGGCVAQQEGRELLARVPYLDMVIGTHAIPKLPELLDEVMSTGRTVCHTDFDYNLARPPKPRHQTDRVTAFLTIMQGCNNFCSYCVVPYVRGREISRSPEDILAEAQDLLASGVKEITLLGQNVNSYGRGLEPAVSFPDLIERISQLDGLKRLRFTTSHPKDLSPRLAQAWSNIDSMCEHVHLPVQSGSNRILRAMGRGYTREDYLRKIDLLRGACPEIAITTDIIVGFPGETEEDFTETMSLASQVRYDGMYSFKYSDRPGTKATRLGGKVDEAVKGRRLAELQELQKQMTMDSHRRLLGRRVEVLVEGRGRRYSRQLTGRTRNNKIVNFEGGEELIGKLVEPAIVEAWGNSLLGVLSGGEPGTGGHLD